jgi:hypothetical protein
VVSRRAVAGSRSGRRVDELIRCSQSSRLSLPLEALHFYLSFGRTNPNVFSLEEWPLYAEVVEGKSTGMAAF